MLSVIIADDEPDVILLCRKLMEYPDAEVIAEAHNGLELLDLIEELHPNTVITDINMPGMTGLELIEEAKEQFPDVNFIVMSGYTDFEYVQKALRFGVWDYLLKPLQKKELNRILKKLDDHLTDTMADEAERAQLGARLDQSVTALKEQYLREIDRTGEAQPFTKGQCFFASDAGTMVCLMLYTDNRALKENGISDSAGRKTESVREFVEGLCANTGVSPVSFRDGMRIVMLLSFPASMSEETRSGLSEQTAAEIRAFNNRNTFLHLTGAVSDSVAAKEDLIPEALRQAGCALRGRLEQPETALLHYDKEADFRVREMDTASLMAGLRSAVADLDNAKVKKNVAQMLSLSEKGTAGSTWRVINDVLYAVRQGAELLPDGKEYSKSLCLTPEAFLEQTGGVKKLSEQIQEYLDAFLTRFRVQMEGKEKGVIEQARQYVQAHYAKELTLEEVAGHVFLSPAYFSTLFKTETGTGFVKYLQSVRVEKAKHLLREQRDSIEEVAHRVGYKDVKHFNKIFKTETGASPGEYRKLFS